MPVNHLSPWKVLAALNGKTTTMRRTAVRENGVCQHHVSPIEGLPEIPRTSNHYDFEGYKEGPQLTPHYAERRQSLRQSM